MSAEQRVLRLEEKLASSRRELADYRKLIEGRFDLSKVAEQFESLQATTDAHPEKARDDDSHYFRSYAENGWKTPS